MVFIVYFLYVGYNGNIYFQLVFMFSPCELGLLGPCSECQNTVTMSTVTFILIVNIYVALRVYFLLILF